MRGLLGFCAMNYREYVIEFDRLLKFAELELTNCSLYIFNPDSRIHAIMNIFELGKVA